MALSSSTDIPLTDADRRTLLRVARSSIDHGLVEHLPLPINPDEFATALRTRRAVFVTLKLDGELRGCIGALEPINTLVEDTARNAFQAAFNDPRFAPLTNLDADRVTIHLSLLTEPRPMTVTDEPDLLRQLRPDADGLILETPTNRATFLPAVWQTLPEPRRFVQQLKLKAGLAPDAWPDGVRCLRYRAETVE